MKKNVAVLHFGGTTVSVVIAAQGAAGNLVILNRVNAEYGGIIESEFVDTTSLAATLTSIINAALKTVKTKIDKLYIGTPPSFCECVVRKAVLNFEKPRKISAREISEIFNSVTFSDSSRTVINKSAVYYMIDNGRPVIDAVGVTCKKVQAQISLITCANNFINIVRNCLFGSGFKRIEFISSALAEALYFIDEETRDRTCVMISCGMFATSVSVCSGDGLVYLKSFEQGIAHVINDVSVVLNTNFSAANHLVNEAILSVKMGEDDNYEITHDGKKMKFGAETVNEIIKSRMEVMGEHIIKLISESDRNLLQNPIFICGGNLDAVEGARDFFSKIIGAHIIQCVCPLTKQNKPSELTIAALLNLALLQEKE